MKKIISVFVLLLCLTGCMSNYDYSSDWIDTNGYNYAIIYLQNGTIVEGYIDKWRDFTDGEQLEVTIDGVRYLTNSFNCTLINKEK